MKNGVKNKFDATCVDEKPHHDLKHNQETKRFNFAVEGVHHGILK
jgi:hypothetical protein